MCGGTIDETIEIPEKIFWGVYVFSPAPVRPIVHAQGVPVTFNIWGIRVRKHCTAKHRLVRVRRKKRNSKSGLGERCGPSLRANPFAAIGSKKNQNRLPWDNPGWALGGNGWGLEEGLWLCRNPLYHHPPPRRFPLGDP